METSLRARVDPPTIMDPVYSPSEYKLDCLNLMFTPAPPTFAMPSPSTWTTFPTEMKLAVIASLDQNDPSDFNTIVSLSKVDSVTYLLCVPHLFRKVRLDSDKSVQNFLQNVPYSYCKHIRELVVSNQSKALREAEARSHDLTRLLSGCKGVQRLDLKLTGSPSVEVIQPFASFDDLASLSIANCSREDQAPLSERLVVSIALNVPHLRSLTLQRISRSTMHAADMAGMPQQAPLVTNDSNVPEHSSGVPLSLPSLLQIPTLQSLKILDTHLGDPLWQNALVNSKNLNALELGGCVYESDEFNRHCTERILSSVGPIISEFTLSVPLASATTSTSGALSPIPPQGGFFATMPVPPMQKLRKLSIPATFPVDDLVSTLATPTLSGSPVESLDVECFDCDMEDVCEIFEEFLALREEQGSMMFYQSLKSIRILDHDSGDVCHDLGARLVQAQA